MRGGGGGLVYFGNTLFNYLRNFFVAWFVTAANREAILLVSCCVACSEELEVNQ